MTRKAAPIPLLIIVAGIASLMSACGSSAKVQPPQPPDVYVAGYEVNGSNLDIAKYWKNGTPVILGAGTYGSWATSIYVSGSDVYVSGREGLLPGWIGKVHPTRKTPVNAIYTFVGIASLIIIVWAILHLVGGHGGSMDPLTFFVESSTMGTILVLVVYFLANLALPFYYRRYRPDEFNVLKHIILPVLGMIAIAVPVYYLVKPGQQAPYDWFPYAALGIIVVSVIYAYVLSRRDPSLGERVGSIIADE